MPLQRGIIHTPTPHPRAGRPNPTCAALTDSPAPFIPQRPQGERR